jgi:hypothetical protein
LKACLLQAGFEDLPAVYLRVAARQSGFQSFKVFGNNMKQLET